MKEKPKGKIPTSVRFKADTEEHLEIASKALGLDVQVVIRLATGIGLEHLRRIDYNLTRVIVDQVEKNSDRPTQRVDYSLNEARPNYAKKEKP